MVITSTILIYFDEKQFGENARLAEEIWKELNSLINSLHKES